MNTPETIPAKTVIRCAGCAKEASIKKRLPTGWKHLADEYRCGDCWQAQYMLRAVILPVVSPVDLEWSALREALKVLWRETTRASNWIVRELALRDVRREPGVAKMPPMPPVYLYPEIRQQFPALPSQTCAAIEQAVTRKYKAKRYEVLWTCSAALPTFRYPQPFPIHNQSWSAQQELDQPLLSVKLGPGRAVLRLKSGSRYRRQLAAFRALCSGAAVPGECSLYQQGDQLMAKMVAWLPRPEVRRKENGILRVRTSRDSLLVAVDENAERLWAYHADQVPRWAAEHRRQLQRWADDSKFEQRPVPRFAARRAEASLRYHRRINTAADEAAALLAGYARRRRFAQLVYDDSERAFCPDFVWFRLAHRLQILCDEYGIEFAAASGPARPELQEALAP